MEPDDDFIPEPYVPPVMDPFYAHEAIDRAHVICCMIDDHLIDHPYVEAHPEIRTKIEQAQRMIYNAYTELAMASDAEFPDPKAIAP